MDRLSAVHSFDLKPLTHVKSNLKCFTKYFSLISMFSCQIILFQVPATGGSSRDAMILRELRACKQGRLVYANTPFE